jgi:urea transport system ATP-binding protein
MMGEPYLLQVEGLTVSFDGFRAVDDLTLYVDKNEMRAVIGPNGAGKTTFLDLVSGKTRASAGKVVFRGNDITHLLEHQIVQAGIGRKFQTPSVYEDLTVFENLEMALPGKRTWWGALRSRRTPEVVDKVREVAATIYLEERLHDRAESLGHGQKQWLEIGMLLIQDPELMMLDEPVAGMSPPERERTGRLLQQTTIAIRRSCSWNSGTPSVRLSTGSSSGCGYVTASVPRRRARYGCTIRPTIGPGRMIATSTTMS